MAGKVRPQEQEEAGHTESSEDADSRGPPLSRFRTTAQGMVLLTLRVVFPLQLSQLNRQANSRQLSSDLHMWVTVCASSPSHTNKQILEKNFLKYTKDISNRTTALLFAVIKIGLKRKSEYSCQENG